ncbi:MULTISPECIES: tyrosine-type recombinase/integrase [Mycobacteriaceae]|uniref:tyrosine-type recombinase/integrase n=1 Tax=Mycobacteroides abscessus TaxID=36809 RepID=UPI000C256657|nr:site-specific integrase [Mycobacteroides abscessus]
MADEPKRKKGYHGKGYTRSYPTKGGLRWRYEIYVPRDPLRPELGTHKDGGRGGFLTEKDADKAKAKALADAARGLRVGAKTPTLAEFAAQWLAAREADPDLETSTVNGDRRRLTVHVLPRIGDKHLDAITTTMLNTLYAQLRTELPLNLPATGRWSAANRKPLGANSVLKIATMMGDLFDSAVDDRHILDNPAKGRGVKTPKREAVVKEAAPMTVWNQDQMTAFMLWLKETRKDSDYPLWATYAATGARRSEVLALRWSDIDMKNNRVYIRRTLDVEKPGHTKAPKNGHPRDFGVTPTLIATLKEWRRLLASRDINLVRGDRWVFPMPGAWDRHRNANSTSEMFTRRVEWAQKDLGADTLPSIHLHEVRHSAATILITNGVDVKTVSERLGHESVKITLDIYTHVTKQSDDRAAALLDFG